MYWNRGRRDTHYQRTLPWGDNGDRLLPSTMYFDYTKAMRDLRNEFSQLTGTFVQNYPALVQEARNRLGSLYDPTDYPDISAIRQRFDVSLSFLPVPDAKDFRVDVGADEVELIKQSITLQMKKQQEGAVVDLWKRLREVISKVDERLSVDEAKIYDSLLENVRTTASFVRKLNLTDNAQMNEVLDDIERRISSANIDQIRVRKTVRKTVAESARDILTRIPT